MTRSITILIPTYNRIRALEAVWPSYLAHPDVARIIVIDDGSTDGTSDRIEELARTAPIPVDVIRHDQKRGQPASRLSGIAAADTEWVLFGEDDVWLEPNYCSALLKEARQLGASMIAGRIVVGRVPGDFSPGLLSDPAGPVRADDQVFHLDDMDADFSARTKGPVPAPFLHSIALIKRSIFDKVLFDTWYSGNSWREETDFYFAAASNGAAAFFTPSAVCYHLRGPISASGGQRINRLQVEVLAWKNTRYLVSKHWQHLKNTHGFRGTPTTWMVRYYARRQLAQLRRIARGGIRSTYRG
ncbi:MAG TPA: glycosyltransferase [Gemmatimonadaceae bacterium]|nr:glycosyltransferase [Gemmatimonadaceae bacterium]